MSNVQLAGSKRKAKLRARDERRVEAVKKRLNRIYQLARLIQSEQELDAYLAAIADETVRAETKKLIEPFLLFRIQRVETAPEQATVLPFNPRDERQPLPVLES